MPFSIGDVDGSTVLTDNDHLYPEHINEFRQSMLATVVVGRTSNCQYYCDGTADDVQIQAALDAVNAVGGGMVFIKAGTYDISTTLKIYSNTTLCGEGWEAILKSGDNLNDHLIQSESSVDRVHIKNIQIDMNGVNNTTISGKHAIRLYGGVTNCVIENIYLHDMAWGLSSTCAGIAISEGGTNCIIRNNYLYKMPDYGIGLVGGHQCQIINNYIHNASGHAIAVRMGATSSDRADKNIISGNIIYFDEFTTSKPDGIKISKVDNSEFSNNIIYYVGDGTHLTGYHGIFNDADVRTADSIANSYYCENNIFSNNIIYNFQYGFYMRANRNTTFSHNYIYLNDFTGTSYGILLDTDDRNTDYVALGETLFSNKCIVDGNTIITAANDADQLGVSIYAARTTYCRIINNFVYNSNRYGIIVGFGAAPVSNPIGTIISNNIVLDSGRYNIYLATACSYGVVSNNICEGASRVTQGSWAEIFLEAGSTYNSVIGNSIYCNKTNRAKYCIREADATVDYNIYANNIVQGGYTGNMNILGLNNLVKDNIGWITQNSGIGTIASGATSATITHGCNYTPLASEITITLTENPTNTPGAIWVDTIGATTFKVNCENDPGASNLDFSWSVRKV